MVATWLLDKNSEKKLATVKPELQHVVRYTNAICRTPFAITSGSRTQLEQDKLFAQGRTAKGHIVTWTRHSKHIGGNAIDFMAFGKDGKVDWHDLRPYPIIARCFKIAAKKLNVPIEWGGDWLKTPDYGHIQLKSKGK